MRNQLKPPNEPAKKPPAEVNSHTLDQNTHRQLEGVQLDRLFTDKASGKDVKRPQLVELVKYIRDGDTLVVHGMDRLARNLDDLRALVQKLTAKGIRIEFLSSPGFGGGLVRPVPSF
ncbi:recombinase family protein [Paenarthrobacter sp. Z7-10]|nr:recombinase family protein [Paenarthrobacter sp. Z7-10]